MLWDKLTDLSRAGLDVCVYNRTAAKATKWAAEFGGQAASTPREAACGAQFVFACVGNDDDLRSVVLGGNGALAGMDPGSVFVDHTTASAVVERELSQKAAERQIGWVDAPVSGGQSGAENGCLTVLCGGTNTDVSAAEPVMRAYAAQITHFGAVESWRRSSSAACPPGCSTSRRTISRTS